MNRSLWLVRLIPCVLIVPGRAPGQEYWYSDCDLDLEDVALLQNCFAGSQTGLPSAACRALDVNNNDRVEWKDFLSVVQALSGPGTPFDYSPSPLPNAEAEQLALEIEETLKTDPAIYDRIDRDLRLIREQFSEECHDDECLPTIHHDPRISMTALSVSVVGDALPDAFVAVNCFFRAKAMLVVDSGGKRWYTVILPAPVNTIRLSEWYRSLPGVHEAYPGAWIGGSTRVAVTREPLARSRFRYTISRGSGDCMAGCLHETTWQFVVTASGNVRLLWRRDR